MVALIAGKPLVLYTYERARLSELVRDVVIATDDDRVTRALAPFGARTVMTRGDHASGTDRIAEVAANSDADIIVNVQGDEPLIEPHTIDKAIRALLDDETVCMATAKRLITSPEAVDDPNVVKVVCDRRGRALYFSRYPIPYVREEAQKAAGTACHWQHIGLYVYRRGFLLEYASWKPTPLERLEKLEQLRVLEHGYSIAVVETEYECVGVDTREDFDRVATILAGDGKDGQHA